MVSDQLSLPIIYAAEGKSGVENRSKVQNSASLVIRADREDGGEPARAMRRVGDSRVDD